MIASIPLAFESRVECGGVLAQRNVLGRESDSRLGGERMRLAERAFSDLQRFQQRRAGGFVIALTRFDFGAKLQHAREMVRLVGRAGSAVNTDRSIEVATRKREVSRIDMGPSKVSERPRDI